MRPPPPTHRETSRPSDEARRAVPRRLVLVGGILAAAWCGVLLKAAREQVLHRAAWRLRAEQQQASKSTVPPTRGLIVDRDGVPLAMSADAVRLAIDVRTMKDTTAALAALAPLGGDTSSMRSAMRRGQRWLPLPYPILFADAAAATRVRGIAAERTSVRLADTSLPSLRALIGHVRDSTGLDGIERARNRELGGRPGVAVLYRSASGRPLSDTITVQPPMAGATIALTISRDLQGVAETALEDGMRLYGATGGDLLVLDIPTGEILALAGRRNYQAVGATLLTEPFEPGSTIKPLLVGLALEAGVTTPDELINTYGGTWSYLGRPIIDVHKGGIQTVREVLANSSNIGMSQLMLRMPPDILRAGLARAGIGRRLGLGIGPETRGVLHDLPSWSLQSRPSLAMGYELSTTLLHLATIYAALASDGLRRQPGLVQSVRDATGAIRSTHVATILDTVVQRATARTLQGMMASVVDSGTGTLARLKYLPVAGKTGTARQVRVGGRGYEDRYAASFIGYVPADAPQYVIAVRLENPTAMYGGTTAAPVAKRVIEALLSSEGARRGLTSMTAAQARGRRAAAALAVARRPDTEDTTTRQASTPRPSSITPAPRILAAPARTAVLALGPPDGREHAGATTRRLATDSVRIPTLDPTASLRDHLHVLSAAGLHIRTSPAIPAGETDPPANSLAARRRGVVLGTGKQTPERR